MMVIAIVPAAMMVIAIVPAAMMVIAIAPAAMMVGQVPPTSTTVPVMVALSPPAPTTPAARPLPALAMETGTVDVKEEAVAGTMEVTEALILAGTGIVVMLTAAVEVGMTVLQLPAMTGVCRGTLEAIPLLGTVVAVRRCWACWL
jgi:hypothetical protein